MGVIASATVWYSVFLREQEMKNQILSAKSTPNVLALLRSTFSITAIGLGISLAGAPQSAIANIEFFTNEAAWQAAADPTSSNTTAFDFNALLGNNYSSSSGLTLDGVNFVGSTGTANYYWLPVSTPGFCCNAYNNPNASLQGPAPTSSYYSIPDGQVLVTLPTQGVTAFGLQAFTVQAGNYSGTATDTINLTADGQTGSTSSFPNAVTGFIGFVSTTAINSAVVTGTGLNDFVNITNVSYVSSVPLPGTFAMMMSGMGILGLLRHKKQA